MQSARVPLSRNRRYAVLHIWGIIVVMCLMIGFGTQLLAPLVAEYHVQKLLSGGLTRSMTTGVIETTAEPYKISPFGVDYVVEATTPQTHTFYHTAIAPSDRGTGDAAEIVTVFLARPTRIDAVFTYDNLATARRPRLFAYDDDSKLVDTANLERMMTVFLPFESPYTASVMLEPGLYRLRMMFARQDVASIQIVFTPDHTALAALSFDEYVISTTKTLFFDIMPGQLTRLQELRAAQEVNWSRLPNGDWSQRYLPSPQESIQVKIRSAQGNWAFAELSLSGRNSAHKSVGGLPSSDVSIKAGELPYGLKKFKLYVVQAKAGGYDMFMERLISDMGVPGYRQDLVKIVVNNQLFGYMQLHEDWDTSLFEAGQFVEGPVIGYDTDALIANPGHSWFQPRSYYNSRFISVNQEIDIGTLEMVQRYCPFAMGTTLASGIFYGGMHGLGADTRFLFDFRRHCVNPVYKDMNTGVFALRSSSYETHKTFDLHPAILGLRMLSVLTPHWRPYTPTYASYFVTRNEQIGSQQGRYFYWTVTPPVMNYATDGARDAEFFMAIERLYSEAHTQRFFSRKRNYDRAITLLNAQPHQSVDLQSPANPPLVSNMLPLEIWHDLVTIPTSCDDAYIRTLIRNASGGITFPDCRDIHRYTWRNTLVRQLLQIPVTDSAGIDITETIITQPQVTFLYQKDRDDVVDLFFVQRNCISGCDGRLWLRDDETQQVITPTQVIESGTVHPPLTQMDVLLTDLVPDEHVRVFHFVIEKLPRYQHLLPQFAGNGVYNGSHGVAVMPLLARSTHANSITAVATTRDVAPLDRFFDVDGNVLTWKENQAIPNERIYIPAGYTWRVSRDTTISLAQQGCFEIWGNLDIDASARLELTDSGNGWSGIRFFLNRDLFIQNLYVRNGGYDAEFVSCGGRRYTGVVGFYETTARVTQMHITHNMAEDALHLVHTDMILTDSSIRDTMSDAVDADYSAVVFRDFQIEGAGGLGTSGGDALDFSGSLAELHGMRLFHSADKNLSCGENSIVRLYDSDLVGGNFGVAIKDASMVELRRTTITGANTGIGVYSKKPYYVRPIFDIAQQDVTFVDVGVAYDPQARAE